MRAFGPGRFAGGGGFTSRNVCIARRINVPTRSNWMASVRHQSSAKEPLRVPQWTQHTLNGSTPSVLESNVSSKASMGSSAVHTAYIALGSNLGDRIDWIEKACNEMSRRGIKVKRTSCLYETEPMYVVDQESFVNGACEVSSEALCAARAKSA